MPEQPSNSSSTTNRRVAGATGIMMVAILGSRLLGLVRDAIISGKLGQSQLSDVYYAAFLIPDLLFFLIAGGALSSAFIPVFTEKITHGLEDEAWHVFSTVACTMTVVVSGFIILGEVFSHPLVALLNYGFTPQKVALATPLTRIVLPAQLCFFLGGLFMGTQYARQRFLIPALGPIIYNIGIIIGGLLLPGAAGFCWGALGGAIAGNFALQLWAVRRSGMRFRVSFDVTNPDVVRVWKLMLPVVLGLALPQVSIVFNKMFASSLGDGPQSALTRANMLMQVPLGVFAQAMAVAIFPTLSTLAAQRRYKELTATAAMGIRSLMFLTIPASVFMIVLASPIIRLLLQHGRFTENATHQTAVALTCYSIGIFAWAAQSVLARAFYAMQDSVTPVIIGTAVTLGFIPLNWLLMTPLHLGYAGLALATSIAAIMNTVAMQLVLQRKLGGFETRRQLLSAAKTLGASAVGGAACWGVLAALEHLMAGHGGSVKMHAAIQLAGPFAVGAGVFGLAATRLKMEEVTQVRQLLRRRRGPSTTA